MTDNTVAVQTGYGDLPSKVRVPKHPFEYHKPNEAQVTQIEILRNSCKQLHYVLLTLPPSRERSIAITKLEEVSMWGNKGIIMVDEGEVAK